MEIQNLNAQTISNLQNVNAESLLQIIQNLRVDQTGLESISQYQSSESTVQSAAENFAKNVEVAKEHEIYTPDAKTQAQLDKTNQKLASQGKAPIDFQKTTKDVESIMNDSSLSDKDKKKKIESLRKELGLSKKEMKNLFTKRLSNIYKKYANILGQYQKTMMTQLKMEQKQAEQMYGKNSAQAQEAIKKQEALKNTIEPQKKQYEQKANLYKSMYPSFWSKLGGFLKKGLNVLTKVISFVKPFVSFIPGVGQLASMAMGAFESVVELIKTKGKSWGKALMNIVTSAIPGGVGGLLGKMGSFGTMISNGLSKLGSFKNMITSGISKFSSSIGNFVSSKLGSVVGNLAEKGISSIGNSLVDKAKGLMTGTIKKIIPGIDSDTGLAASIMKFFK